MYPSLTGIRFWAASAVFLTHFALFQYFYGIQDGFLHTFFVAMGATGVSVFFVLSGFILYVRYCADEKPIALHPFWVARFARIYPAFFLALLMGAPIELLGNTKNFAAMFIPHVFLLQSFHPYPCGEINSVDWTISHEAFFYLLFPLLALLFRGRILMKVGLFFLAYYLVSFIARTTLPEGFYTGFLFPPYRVGEFAAGMTAGWLFVSLRHHPALQVSMQRIRWLLLPGILLLMGILLAKPWFVPEAWGYAYTTLPAVLLILLLALCDQTRLSPLMMAHPLIVLGGEVSYALYLIHTIVFRYVRHGLYYGVHFDLATLGPVSLSVFGVLLFLGCNLLAWMIYRWVEAPARRLINNVLKPRSTRSPIKTVLS
ncbi:MAG: acyltransferase family protein [Candidatus Melainabacteria bacterium]